MAVAPRLVILRALGLGDLLTGVPALRALARAFPRHRRLLAAPRGLEPLAALIRVDGEPAVHELVDTHGLGADLAEPLRGADLAVNLHGRGPQSHRLLLAAAPRLLITFEHPEIPDARGMPEWRAGEHEVARWCRLLAESGIAADPAELAIEPPATEPPSAVAGATLIHPGAASGARRWPAERWAEVARAELESGRSVAISGAPAERELALAVARMAGIGSDRVLAGRTDVAQLASAVAVAGRVACGDTGVAHLATALGTPSVVLFGPTPPAEWGPPRSGGRHVALWAGERGDPHGEQPDAGLLGIEAPEVSAALAGLAAAEVAA